MSGDDVSAAAGITVTVAVCTRDRTSVLARALDSLLALEPRPHELLVVDNAPSDEATRTLIEERYRQVRYVREPVGGLDFARNRALREARGDVVAFIDDDAVADPGWVGAIGRAYADSPEAGACSGRILPLSLETEGQRLFEANGGLFAAGEERLRLPGDRIRSDWHRRVPMIAWAAGAGSGCNLSVRRPLALELGGFDEALDLGQALPGGGDNDMLWRILEHGSQVVYEPGAIVHHEHRRELEGAEAQILGHQRALVALTTKAFSSARGVDRLTVGLYLGWRLVKPGFRLLKRGLGRDPLPADLLWSVWRSCWQGLGSYAEGVEVAAERRLAAGVPAAGVPSSPSSGGTS